MTTPIVLVTSDSIVHNGLTTSATPAPYLAAVAASGLVPLQLPTIAESFAGDPLLAIAGGVLVTGARSNVHPSQYGAEESEAAAPFDRDRDRTTLPLIRATLSAGLPLLAICRGLQELNVALGGTLDVAVRERPGRADHLGQPTEDMDEKFAIRHDVSIEPGGLLERIVGAGPLAVNSVHRQAIDRVGEALRVEAVAPDGTIEAVSVPGHPFALAVQWHPEYTFTGDAPSRAIFEAFAAAVAAFSRTARKAA